MPPRNGFDGALQLGQREFRREKFKHHGPILQLRAQPRNRSAENAAMIETHRLAERRELAARKRRLTAVSACLLDQSRFVEEFVAVEHLLFVPRAAVDAKAEPQPL